MYTSQVLVGWQQSLEDEFVSDDASLNSEEKNMYLTMSHFCIFYSLNENEIHICLQEVEVTLLIFFDFANKTFQMFQFIF